MTTTITTETTTVEPGLQFRSVIADCNALWEVVSHSGLGVWQCVVVDEPISIGNGQTVSGEYAGERQPFNARDILGKVNLAARLAQLAADRQASADSLVVGSTVHLRDRRDAYIRCRVVENAEGAKQLLPLGFVGTWSDHSVAGRVGTNGEIFYSYEARQILEGELRGFNPSFIVESDAYRDEVPANLADLPLIEITTPELTDRDRLAAVVHTHLEAATAQLRNREPEQAVETLRSLLAGLDS